MKHRSFGSLVCAGVLLLFLPALAAGQPASLLRDINSDIDDRDFPPFLGDINSLRAAGDRLYFVASGGGTGSEVWVSDGTPRGTEVLRDVCPGGCGSAPELIGGLGGIMLWTAEFIPEFSIPQRQLWRSDGIRPGTFALTDQEISVELPTFFHGALYFVGCSLSGVERDCDLWQTDGSVAGTRIFQEAPRSFSWLDAAGDRLYYLVKDNLGSTLWVTDGTAAGTVQLRHFEWSSDLPHGPVSAGGRLFFLARDNNGEEVWTSDGTVAGTRPVTNFPGLFSLDLRLKPVGSRIYFVADDGLHGREIWRTDGTDAGTVRLTEMADDAELFAYDPSSLAEVGGIVVFKARVGNSQTRLWTTQGTPGSTAPLTAACGDCSLDDFSGLVVSGGRVFFLAEKGSNTELWITDGTAAGSRRVRELCAGCNSGPLQPWKGGVLFPTGFLGQIWFSDGTPAGTAPFLQPPAEASILTDPFEMAELGGNFYFFAEGQSQGLWVRDTAGTVRPVFTLPVAGPTSEPRRLTSFAGRLLFTAEESRISSEDLWSSAGTPETTGPVNTPIIPWNSATTGLVPASGLLYFQVGETFVLDRDLWRTDGTSQGTFVVTHPQTIAAAMVPYQGALYFFDGQEIWRTNGTVQGTVKTGDLPADLVRVEIAAPGPNGIYFRAVTDSNTTDFWFTDGTTAGTRRLTNRNANGAAIGSPEFTSFGPYVYFSWEGLWRTDGTAAGTTKLENLISLPANERVTKLLVHQGALYFFTADIYGGPSKPRLWRTDGTSAGTVQLGQFFSQNIGLVPLSLTPFGGKLFFNVNDGAHGIELWATDGTPAGTAMVRDLNPGPRSSAPTELTVAGGRLFFAAGDDVHGNELWQSDGTAAGTRLVQDIGPQAFSSAPQQLTVAGDKLYFTADDSITGREIWVLPLSGPTSCQPSSTRLCLSGGRYAVEAAWEDFEGHRGVGHAVALTSDTGYFWFFGPSNVEAVLKVLDGRAINDHVWVFYGALSTVEYSLTVTDTETGLTHRYVNPSGQLASVGDTAAFGPLGATTAAVATSVASPSSSLTLVNHRVVPSAATGACSPSSTRLCLNGSRFAVEIAWKDFAGHTGHGQAVELTSDTGLFWFFGPDNVEVMLKVLDGTPVNGHHWVFYGALSNVEYTVTVTDTQTGQVNTYRNPSGQFASVADTGAF